MAINIPDNRQDIRNTIVDFFFKFFKFIIFKKTYEADKAKNIYFIV
ncbi:MAG: hypothetical protein FWF46_05670 [Oscillospiraceae bacterium]|nr:hypothetical protein [Oscillospiraceae bacterium]